MTISKKIDDLQKELECLEIVLEDREASLSAHSPSPRQMIEIEELEDEI